MGAVVKVQACPLVNGAVYYAPFTVLNKSLGPLRACGITTGANHASSHVYS